MDFEVEYLIRFQHCDPAGIVFYPHYYEMFNQLVEDWFAEGLHLPFMELARREEGVPLAHATCDFITTSKIGDRLVFSLRVRRLGTKSITLNITARLREEVRLRAELVLVYVCTRDPMHGIPIPADLRRKMEAFIEPV